MHLEHLHINRKLQNHAFETWRLGGPLLTNRHLCNLANSVSGCDAEGAGYIAALLNSYHNNLFIARGTPFFTTSDGQKVVLNRLVSDPTHSSRWQPSVVTDITPPHTPQADAICNADPALSASPRLCTSLVHVQGGENGAPMLLLLSNGVGDLAIVSVNTEDSTTGGTGGTGSTYDAGTVIHHGGSLTLPTSSRPLPPFMLEAALQLAPGLIRVALWAVEDQAGDKQVCAVYVVDLELKATEAQEGATSGEGVRVRQGWKLQCSRRPPQLVLLDPSTGAVLLGTQPGGDNANVSHHHPGGTEGAEGMEEEDEDEVDPRTLQEAAARLAQYTSEEQAAPGPSVQPWADLYREGGPEGEGELEGEPTCSLSLYPLPPSPAPPNSDEALPLCEAATIEATWQLDMEPHCLISVQGSCMEARGAAGSGCRALLGVADDVDCAVVRVTFTAGSQLPQVAHVASIPALAYVTAGKQHRRHLLLAEPGDNQLAAVLVEAEKYCYMFRSVPPREQYGVHQVVEMEGGDGARVVGSQLLAPGQNGSGHVLFVLTSTQLHVLQLAV